MKRTQGLVSWGGAAARFAVRGPVEAGVKYGKMKALKTAEKEIRLV